jgi:DNA-binding CsgD family transcriptional regulator
VPEIASVVSKLGFDSFTYWADGRSTSIVEGRLYELSTLASGWTSHYDELNYIEVDPRVSYVMTQALPIAWDQLTWRGRAPAVDSFLEDAAQYGIGCGVCVPIHDPSFGISRFEFNATDRELEPQRRLEIDRAFGEFMIAARLLHDLFVAAIRRNEIMSRATGMPLSAREVACLSLATRGRSALQIADELCIDVRVVNIHFDSIRAKLSCLNRDEAIAIAIKGGLLAL